MVKGGLGPYVLSWFEFFGQPRRGISFHARMKGSRKIRMGSLPMVEIGNADLNGKVGRQPPAGL